MHRLIDRNSFFLTLYSVFNLLVLQLVDEEFTLCNQLLPDTPHTTELCNTIRKALRHYFIDDARDIYNCQDVSSG